MNVKTHLKHIKLINDLSVEFKSGNLYLVRGSNNQGKTTFTLNVESLFTGKTGKNVVSHEQDNGLVDGEITGLDGKTYKVIINHKKNKNPSFSIIQPNLQRSSRKGDLAAIFSYENVTAETFAGWGLTEPGRRKQAEMFMKLMPKEIQEQIYSLDNDINTTNGVVYIARRDAGVALKYEEKNALPEPTEEQLSIYDKVDEWTDAVNKMSKQYDYYIQENNKIIVENNDLKSQKAHLENERERITSEIKRLQEDLKAVNDTYESLGEEKPLIKNANYLLQMKEKIKKSNEAIFTATEARSYIERYNASKEKLKSLNDVYNELTESLKKKREEKAKLIKENLKTDSISIENGQLLYNDEKGKYPINEENLSYSRIALIVASLVIKLNPNYPIVFLGKASEFDKETILKFVKYAQQTESIIVADYVDNSGELKIDCYEDYVKKLNQ